MSWIKFYYDWNGMATTPELSELAVWLDNQDPLNTAGVVLQTKTIEGKYAEVSIMERAPDGQLIRGVSITKFGSVNEQSIKDALLKFVLLKLDEEHPELYKLYLKCIENEMIEHG